VTLKAESLKLNQAENNILVGVGLRHTHFPYLESTQEKVCDFFEVISENFMSTKGRPRRMLDHVRKSHPIAMHGVSLSIASTDELDTKYLSQLRNLAQEINPIILSDHLCWTGGNAHNLHNLLPFPYTNEALEHVIERVQYVQDYLQRPLTLENLSAYLSYNKNEMDEIEFMNELCQKAGCSILLDLNNLYVNSVNIGFDAKKALSKINFDYVKQIHLAGYSDFGTHLFDTHSKEVQEPVWELLKLSKSKLSDQAILIEWDEDIPEFDVLLAEVSKVKEILKDKA